MEKRIIILTCCLFFYTNLFSQLTANFSANTTTICVGQSISFTNLSSPDAITWDWSFQTATGVIQNYIGAFPPAITYNTPGNYYVILVVEDLGGIQDAEIKYNYINVVSSPIITLTSAANSNNQIICQGNSLQPTITYSVNYASSATVTGLPAGVGFSVSTTPTGCLVTITGTPTLAGVYPFSVESLQNFCSNIPTLSNGTITVNPPPTVNAGPDQSICAGTAVTLTASGATTYSWNNGVSNGVAFTPSSTGTYTVTGTSASNCVNTDQVVVTVNNLPIVNAGPNQSICSGTAVTLTASGATSYSWNNGVSNGVAFTPLTTATYTVTGTNAANCTNTDQVVVNVNALPTVNAGIDQTVCAGSVVTLSGTGANTYSWNNGVTNGVAFTPSSTTTYTVTGTNAANCTNTDQVVVNVNALPIVNAGIDQTVCAGTAVTLSGSGANTYSWNNGVSNGVAFTPSSTVTYTVTGTNAANCINTDQVVVNVNALPTVNAGIDQTVCAGTAVTLSGSGANTYSWNNGVTNGVAFTPALTTTYTVTGTNTSTGCTNTDQVLVTVDVLPVAIAGGNITICSTGTAAVFGASASGGNVLWTHNGNGTLTNATTLTPTYNSVNSDAGNTVTLTLTVNNVNSCGNQNAFAFFTVVVDGSPTLVLSSAAATNNQLVCNNTAITNIQYLFGGAGNSAFVSGLPAGVVFNISGNLLTISGSPSETGTFNYMVSTIGACPSIMLMGTIESQGSTLELLSAPYTNNQLICLGNSIEPIVYGIGSPAILNDLPAGLVGTFSPGIPNTYTITGIPLNIGSSYYTININGQCGNEFLIGNLYIQPFISGNTSGNDTTVCDGSSFELVGGTINTNGNTVYNYLWEYSSNVNGPFIPAPGINTSANYTSTMNAGDPFNYFRRIVLAGACSDTAAVVFVSADPLPAIISIGSATICVNQTALIQPIVISNGTIVSWTTTGFGDLLNTSTAIPSYKADSLDAGTLVNINFLVQSNNVCAPAQISGSFPVTVLALPSLSLLSNQGTMSQTGCVNAPIDAIEIAIGGGATNAVLTGSIPVGVTASFNGGIFTISGIPSQTGLFNFTISTQGSACTEALLSGSIEIVSPFISLISSPFSNNQTICANNSINTIVYSSSDTIIAQGLPIGITSTFLPGSPNTFSISGTPTNTGVFYYMLSTGGLCANGSATGTITVVQPIVGNTSGNDTTVCDGSSFELVGGTINTNGNTVYNYLWEYSSNVNGPFIPAPGINTSANYTSTMNAGDPFNYFRRIVLAGACSDTAAVVFVSADSIPEIIFIGNSSICSNDTVNVSTISILNGSITSWISSGNGQLITTDMNNPIYIADSSDAGSVVNLTFVLTSNNVCSPDSLVGVYPITVRPNPIAFLGGNIHICAVDMDAVVTGALAQNGNFQWSDNGFGNLSNTNSLSPVYTSVIEDTGSVVSIYLEVSSGTDCTYPLIDTAIFTVTVDSVGINPEIISFAGEDVTISLGESIELNAQGVAITTWIWSPSASLSENGIYNPIASPTQTTQYILTVYNILGCVDIDTIEITVIPDVDFNIPSLFTPNGDGLNETWEMPELILLPNTSVTIINREGQEVFSSDNYTNNWDGTYKGNPLPEATYYYWIKFANSDSIYKGPVTILRNIK